MDEKVDTVSLTRRLPVIHSGWLMYRKAAILKLSRGYRTVFAELRGGNLFLYLRTAEDDVENNTPLTSRDLEKEPPSRVIELGLVESLSRVSGRKMRFVTADSSGEAYEIRFRNQTEGKEWMKPIEQQTGMKPKSLNDFEILSVIGSGATGTVFYVLDKESNTYCALKVIQKCQIFRTDDALRHAVDERLVMELAANHPFVLNLQCAFQSSERLYLVTELCTNGDLFEYLGSRKHLLREGQTVRLAAEILLGLEFIHSLGIVYRDLKLENLLLDEHGHIRIADFGLSKLITEEPTSSIVNLTDTFCGTREYLAPEMLAGKKYGHSVDLWAYGVLIYELLCGRTPFYSSRRDEIYSRIESAPLEFPVFVSDEAKDIIQGLLNRNPMERLGANGIGEVKGHPFFAAVDWEGILRMEKHPDNLKINTNKDSKTPECSLKDSQQAWLLQDRAEMTEPNSRRELFTRFMKKKNGQPPRSANSITGYAYAPRFKNAAQGSAYRDATKTDQQSTLALVEQLK